MVRSQDVFNRARTVGSRAIIPAFDLTVLHDFEDGDIAEWTGDTADYNVEALHPFNGSFNLSAVAGAAGAPVIVTPNPVGTAVRGDYIKYNVKSSNWDDTFHEFIIGPDVPDSRNGHSYRLRLDTRASPGSLRLDSTVNDVTTTAIAEAAIDRTNYIPDQYAEIHFDWGFTALGDLTIKAFNTQGVLEGSATVTNADHDDGPEIATRVTNVDVGDDLDIDYFRVDNLVQTPDVVPIIDSFEDGGIAEYTGDTGSFAVETADPFRGGHNLTESGSGGAVVGIQTASPVNAAARGDYLKFNLKVSDWFDSFFEFAIGPSVPSVTGGDNYRIRIDSGGSPHMRLDKNVAGATTTGIASFDFIDRNNFDAAKYAEFHFDWGFTTVGDLTIKAFNTAGEAEGSATVADADHDLGNEVGIRINNYGAADELDTDHWRIDNVDQTPDNGPPRPIPGAG